MDYATFNRQQTTIRNLALRTVQAIERASRNGFLPVVTVTKTTATFPGTASQAYHAVVRAIEEMDELGYHADYRKDLFRARYALFNARR